MPDFTGCICAMSREDGAATGLEATCPQHGVSLHPEQSSELPQLFACHPCQLIGPEITAKGHEIATGHVSERISDRLALGVRQQWAREGRSIIDGEDLPEARS